MATRTTGKQIKRIMDRITPELRKKYRAAQQRPGAKKLPRLKDSGAKMPIKLPKPKRGYSEQQQKVRKKKGGKISGHNRLY